MNGATHLNNTQEVVEESHFKRALGPVFLISLPSCRHNCILIQKHKKLKSSGGLCYLATCPSSIM